MRIALPLFTQLPRCGDPLVCHHGGPATVPALAACMLEPKACVLSDRVDAQLREHGNDTEQGLAHRRSGVDQRFGQRHDVEPAFVEVVQRIDHQSLGAGEAIEPAHLDRVAGASVIEQPAPILPVSDPARYAVVDEDPRAAGRAQLGHLRVNRLLSRRVAGVPQVLCHAENVTRLVSE